MLAVEPYVCAHCNIILTFLQFCFFNKNVGRTGCVIWCNHTMEYYVVIKNNGVEEYYQN